jgi:hypothetical protein
MQLSIADGPWLEFSVKVVIVWRICVDKRRIELAGVEVDRSTRFIPSNILVQEYPYQLRMYLRVSIFDDFQDHLFDLRNVIGDTCQNIRRFDI